MKLKDYIFRYSYFYVLEGDIYKDEATGVYHRMQVNGIALIHVQIFLPSSLQPVTDAISSDAYNQHPGFEDTTNQRLIYFSYLGRKFILPIYIRTELRKFFNRGKK